MENKEKDEKLEKKEIIDEELLKEKTKNLSIKEGIHYSVMDGFGLRNISPYALALGADNHQIGLLTSIPSLVGNFSQLFTSRLIEKHPRKKIIFFGILMQALMWLPLLFLGYLFFYKNANKQSIILFLIFFYTLITFFGAFISPAWNSLMKDVVTKDSGKYFGKRNKILGAVVLVSMLGSGLILNFFKDRNEIFFGFAILLFIAFISRFVSGRVLLKHYEPPLKIEKGYYFSFIDFVKRFRKNNFGRFTLFISLMMLATSIASPFFTVYMLKDLNLNYFAWTLISFASALSTLIFMPFWGKLIDRFGNLKILKITGGLIFLVPLLWFLTFFFKGIELNLVVFYLFVIEFFSGIIWAGFNLTSVTFIYDAVTPQRLSLCVAYYNILGGIGVFLGATLGGMLSSLKINIFNGTIILLIFLISSFARLLVYLIMIPKIKEVKEKVEEYKKGEIKKEMKNHLKKELDNILLPIKFVYNKIDIYPITKT